MNSLRDKGDVVTDATYVILGATGNTGSIIANSLLLKGEKVRVVGRDAGRLQGFVRKGAEAFTANVSDAVALTNAFSGARAAYLMLPPITSREDQERESDAIAKAAKESGLRHAVYLSSYGAHVPEGTGPVAGLHSSEQKLNAISGLNVLHLRAAYFMENNLAAIGMIHGMGRIGHALLPDLKLPMIATRDVGDYAAQRLLDLDFSGKQTRELMGERDLSMAEATTIIAARHWQTGSALRAVSVRPGAAGARANGHAAEEIRGVHRDVQGDQRRCPRCAGAAFAGEQHADFV
jgi:uncharacterized protein YbjT (DUF2867 family)